jgi:hypothetical protein
MVLGNALAGVESEAEAVLRAGEPLFRGPAEPLDCFGIVLRDALADSVNGAEPCLSLRVPLLRCLMKLLQVRRLTVLGEVTVRPLARGSRRVRRRSRRACSHDSSACPRVLLEMTSRICRFDNRLQGGSVPNRRSL